ncbi:hypothetical protein HII17_05945 [Thalassotalea sp. M1531]|uniref:Uncharacterized protein n=1 Tax=Thalassotalea algicola TaxID=2716224 RepID=A0A7Y0LB67_9GAMM|nr:hypothetical protein [Thalassotalea algicola]NMP31102.1 hypothetical protein [Thalassotalea algicola]
MKSKIWLVVIFIALALAYEFLFQPIRQSSTENKITLPSEPIGSTSSNQKSQARQGNEHNAEKGDKVAGNFSETFSSEENPEQRHSSKESKLEKTTSDILACAYQEESEQENEAKAIAIETFANELLNADNTELQKTAYLFNKLSSETSPHHTRIFLDEYLHQRPDDKLAVLQLLNTCKQLPHDTECNQTLAENIDYSDPENGVLWLQLAALMLAQENQQAFTHYLKIAIEKTSFSNYFFEYIGLFFDSAYGVIDLPFNQVYTLGSSLVSSADISSVINYCGKVPTSNTTLFGICQQLGSSMQIHADDMLLQAMGAGISRESYKKSNDQTALANQIKVDEQRYKAMFNLDWQNAQSLIVWDDELMTTWIEHGKLFGEQAAVNALIEEAKIKSLNPDYRPCQQ